MPVYEYACTACLERTEAKQGFDDPPLETCPRCGGKLRKLYSPVGIVFKGSGFYSTDAKKPTGGKAKKEDQKKEPKSESKSSEARSSTDRSSEGGTSTGSDGSK